MTEMSTEMRLLTEAFQRLSIAIGEALLPAMRAFDSVYRAWLDAWPGMPYTGPSPWEPEQMLTYPSREEERSR